MNKSQTHHFEIEIKSLLGAHENAKTLEQKLLKSYPAAKIVEESKQLNHYFVGPDDAFPKLAKSVKSNLSTEDQKKMAFILEKGKKLSLRTRQLNEQVILVIKASIDDTTSSNGISRMEFEAITPKLSLMQLDQLLLDAGFSYQAKWSRQRKSYQVSTPQISDVTICLDKNAGYGYLAEFEALVEDPNKTESTTKQLRDFMDELGAVELKQDRLERMFAYYNENWPAYYGTDKVFIVE